MNGPRWVLKSSSGKTYAELSEGMVSAAMASAFGQLISDKTMIPLMLRIERGPRRNPTLVAHGLAKAARWHVITANSHAAVADFYMLEPETAAQVTEAIATATRLPMLLLSNRGLPRSIGGHALVRSRHGAIEHRPNPAGHPVRGELWKTAQGGRCRVLEVTPGRVHVLHMDSGNREWIDRGDFLASYKPVRPNPKEKGRKGAGVNAHSIATRLGYPFIRGDGKAVAGGTVWLSRFTKKMDGTGGAVFVGFDHKTGKTVIQYGNRRTATPGRSRRAHHYGQARSARGVRRPGPSRRRANPKGRKPPTTIKEGVAQLLDEAGFAGLARDVRRGGDQIKALRIASNGANYVYLPMLREAINVLERARTHGLRPNPKGRNPRVQPGSVDVGAAVSTFQLNDGNIVYGWPGDRGPKHYLARTQALAALSKLADSHMFQVWQPMMGRSFYLRWIGRMPNPKGRNNSIATAYREGRITTAEMIAAIQDPARLAKLQAKARRPNRRVKRLNPLPRWVDTRSIRTVGRGAKRILTGCPRGKWSTARRRCSVGTRRVNPVRGKARGNPRDSEVARARRTFRHLNQIEPGTVRRVSGARNAPNVAVKLGELVSFVYRSDKYAGQPDNPKGKALLYEHRTRRPRPVLATDPDGREVHIVGGRMHPTPDGLVN